MGYVKIKNLALLFSLVVVAFTFSNCASDSTDDGSNIDPTTPTVALNNDELKTALSDLGFTFNSKGELVLDSVATGTEELNLSNSGLTSAAGLEYLTALKSVDLSGNDFDEYFECADLPSTLESLTFNDNDATVELNDLEKMASLKSLRVEDCDKLTRLEMPSSLFGSSSYVYTNISTNALRIKNCESLTTVSMPSTGDSFGLVALENLPKVTYLDLSKLSMIHTMILSGLSSSIGVRMPTALSAYVDGWGSVSTDGLLIVAADSGVRAISSIATFLTTFSSNILDASDYYLD
ncbi:MAG: hypothetical protein SNH13_03330 [Rikenellaceae bacterium]